MIAVIIYQSQITRHAVTSGWHLLSVAPTASYVIHSEIPKQVLSGNHY